tara:strand:+ start:329 stop:2194 length:1866 start_codon:yes stop_codon:yes gene_type:complete
MSGVIQQDYFGTTTGGKAAAEKMKLVLEEMKNEKVSIIEPSTAFVENPNRSSSWNTRQRQIHNLRQEKEKAGVTNNNPRVTTTSAYTMLKNEQYAIDKNTKVRETIDLNIKGGKYGKPTEIKYQSDVNSRGKGTWKDVDPDSDLAKAIEADPDGSRGNAYRNTMDDVANIASKQTTLTEKDHETALRESGMYDAAKGITSYSGDKAEVPDNTTNVDETVGANGEEEQKKDETTPAPVTNTKKEKSEESQTLAYPKSMSERQDYLFIEAFEYKAPQADSLARHGNRQVKNMTKGQGNQLVGPNANRKGANKYKTVRVDIRNEETQKKYSLANTINSGLGRGHNVGHNKKDIIGTVRLPIPNKLLSSTGVDWGEGRINALEAGAFSAVQGQISSVLGGSQNLAGALGAGVDGLKQTFEKLPELGKGQSGQLISSVLSKTALSQIGINVDPSQMIARSTGMAINPNLELLFSSPKLRTFSFVFQFAPDDDKDATEVRKIQRFFRQGMLPTNNTSNNGDKLYLGSPYVFRLCFKNNGKRIKGLNIFKICALTSCEIDFTPDNVYQAYDDGQAVSMPVRSNMTLTFTELTPIFKNDYDKGSKDPSMVDLGLNVSGENAISDDDVGF